MRCMVLVALLAGCVGDNPNAIQDGFRYDLASTMDLIPAGDMALADLRPTIDLAPANDLRPAVDMLMSTDLRPSDLALCKTQGAQCTVGTECCSGTCEAFGLPPNVTYICA